jgi:hypothetical protein
VQQYVQQIQYVAQPQPQPAAYVAIARYRKVQIVVRAFPFRPFASSIPVPRFSPLRNLTQIQYPDLVPYTAPAPHKEHHSSGGSFLKRVFGSQSGHRHRHSRSSSRPRR